MQDIMNMVFEYVITYGMNVCAAVIIFFAGKWIARVVAGIAEELMHKAKMEKTLCVFFKNIAYFALLSFVVIAALNKLGIETTSFIAVLGAAGLAVGLALQGSLANFAAGVMLIMFKPFKVGDAVNAGGVTGAVQEIQIFNTVLTTPDNRRIIVPNSKITGDVITNFSDIENRRIDLVFGISYNDDIKKAKEVLARILSEDKRILTEPKPLIAVSELGESSVNLACRPWVKPENYWDVYSALLERGKLELEKNGITLPYPQRDVHVYNK